jgi:hypothetical protein
LSHFVAFTCQATENCLCRTRAEGTFGFITLISCDLVETDNCSVVTF